MNAKGNKTLIDSKTESNAIAALKQLPSRPPESKKSARAVINGMAELIRARIASGYTYEQIAEVLSGAGVHVAAATLRAYLAAGKAAGSKRNSAKKPQKVESQQRSMFASHETTQAQRPATSPRPPGIQDPDEK